MEPNVLAIKTALALNGRCPLDAQRRDRRLLRCATVAARLSLADPPLTITACECVCACSALLLRGWVRCGAVGERKRKWAVVSDYHSRLLCS